MEGFKEFLEYSTIHGLTYISSSKSLFSKFFWTIIVALSFVTSIILIESLFSSWSEDPISTTVETKPISKSPFPRVSVCPPANSMTSMNWDLKKAENLNLTEGFKQHLANISAELIEDEAFNVLEREEKKFVEENKFLNWYTGFTKPTLPHNDIYDGYKYSLFTSAVKGSISTPDFQEPFKLEKFKKKCLYEYTIYLRENITNITTSLVLNIRLEIVGELGAREYESLYIEAPGNNKNELLKHSDDITRTYLVDQHFVGRNNKLKLRFIRRLDETPNRKLNLTRITGVSFNWHFREGNKIQSRAKYIREEFNLWFIRLVNYIFARVTTQSVNINNLFEVAKKFRIEWLSTSGALSVCHVITGNDVVGQFLTKIQRNQETKIDISEEPLHKNELTNSMLEASAKIFLYLTNCANLHWIFWRVFFKKIS